MTSATVRRGELGSERRRAAVITPVGMSPSTTTNAGASDMERTRLLSYTVVEAGMQPRETASLRSSYFLIIISDLLFRVSLLHPPSARGGDDNRGERHLYATERPVRWDRALRTSPL